MAGSSLTIYDGAQKGSLSMPVFGKSLFETVLEGMETEEVEEEDPPVLRRPRMATPFLADTAFSDDDDPARAFANLYDDFADPPETPHGPIDLPKAPDWIDRLSDDHVAVDLGLAAGMSPAEIRARRRAFARSNHPDRVHEDFRAAATIRMTIANRLAEAALRAA